MIFIEPKYQIYVYDAKSIKLLAKLPTNNILIGTSAISLISANYDLYFIYELPSSSKVASLRVCQVRFNRMEIKFENKICLEKLSITCNKTSLRIHGFTIKKDHAGTSKSLLFISSNFGLIHTGFNTRTGTLTRSPVLMRDTLSEGNVVVSPSETVYYANKVEDTIYELIIMPDFRIRYGKFIKSNAIKNPYGLSIDDCNHL